MPVQLATVAADATLALEATHASTAISTLILIYSVSLEGGVSFDVCLISRCTRILGSKNDDKFI